LNGGSGSDSQVASVQPTAVFTCDQAMTAIAFVPIITSLQIHVCVVGHENGRLTLLQFHEKTGLVQKVYEFPLKYETGYTSRVLFIFTFSYGHSSVVKDIKIKRNEKEGLQFPVIAASCGDDHAIKIFSIHFNAMS
jgi:hypothetical protein